MARKTATLKIEGRKDPFELKEMTVKEIIDLMQGDFDTSLDGLKQLIDKFLPLCSNIKQEDLYSMTPSEIEGIWEQFKEINSVFFRVSQQMGLNSMLGDLKEAVIKDFSSSLAALSKKDMSEL